MYYTVVDKDAGAPNKTDIAAGTSLGAVASNIIEEKEVTLSLGANEIYLVVKDEANDISDPLKIQVGAYVPPVQSVANKLTVLGFCCGKWEYCLSEWKNNRCDRKTIF